MSVPLWPPLEHLTMQFTVKDGDRLIAECSTTDGCIHDLYVHTDYRRNGIATAMIRAMLTEFGATWLWVRSSNEEAVALYNNLGFKIAEIDDGYYKMEVATSD